MKLNQNASLLNLNDKPKTHMVFAAHQDDIEIMCGDGILRCYKAADKGLVGVVVSDGAGSPRSGKYADLNDMQMKLLRREEQIKAARLGNYAALALLNFSSKEIKDTANTAVAENIKELLAEFKPAVVYTHNLADKHPTHVAVAVNVIKAIRAIPQELRPTALYGCEVWRDLDWLSESDKVVFDLTGGETLLRSLIQVYDSQIAGGKLYDKAIEGRRLANATFGESHAVDTTTAATFAMNLTPLITDDTLNIREFLLVKVNKFISEILV